MTFAHAVTQNTAKARTTNGMKALPSSGNPLTDLFFNVGALRGRDPTGLFAAAYAKDKDVALRIALWARDVRGGAGERKVFRDILSWLCVNDAAMAMRVLSRVPELGRWDDLSATSGTVRDAAYVMIRDALAAKNGLAAKWLPRKGPAAVEIRNALGMTPKQYRKTLVGLTKVVETQMCAKDWDNINFSHVPSVASARYKKAFGRHTQKYAEYCQALEKGDKSVKVNAGATFPYDVLKGLVRKSASYNKDQLSHIKAQWEALPDYMGDMSILPLVDVSGSMTCPAGGWASKSTLTCLEVAVSLGLYMADKNKGVFKDVFCTFSSEPTLMVLRGDILAKVSQMVTSRWEMSTNLEKAFERILDTAVKGKVSKEDMPKVLMILSDMQFNSAARYDDRAIEMIARKYGEAGYEVPKIVFWNLNAQDNTPVSFDEKGTALVSGFSPAIVKSIMSGNMNDFSPESIMMKTIMVDRYAY